MGLYLNPKGQPNVTMALQKLKGKEVGFNPIEIKLSDGRSRSQVMKVISESGLYKLVMRSDKPQAKKFQDWVTRDVLPTIRKTGQYNVHAEKVAKGEMSLTEMTLKVLEGLQEQLRLETEKVAEMSVLNPLILNIRPAIRAGAA